MNHCRSAGYVCAIHHGMHDNVVEVRMCRCVCVCGGGGGHHSVTHVAIAHAAIFRMRCDRSRPGPATKLLPQCQTVTC
jgi:hypothetical protein